MLVYQRVLWNIKFMFETTNQNMPGKMIIITLYILSSFLWLGNRRRNADNKKGVVRPWKVIYKWKKIIELGTDGVAITYLESLGFSMVADKKILGISKHKQNLPSMRTEGISMDSMGISVVSILMVGFRAPKNHLQILSIPVAHRKNLPGQS